MRYQVARIVFVAGLLIGFCGSAIGWSPPFLTQAVLRWPVADVFLIVLVLATVASLMLWAREPGHRDRVPLVATLISIGVLAVVSNILAPQLGWWGGRVFEAPLVPLALLTSLTAMFLIGALLLLYRRVAAQRPRLALLTYLSILVALVPATIFSDQVFLRTDTLTFNGGYTIACDVLFGEVAFALPLVLYALFRRWLKPAEQI